MLSVFHREFHPLFETLGYLGGFGVFTKMQRRQGDSLTEERRWIVLASAAVGALLGSRLLGLLEKAPAVHLQWRTLLVPGGKTIVGGLLGGWIIVEIAKYFAGIKTRTGDLLAVPLCVGIAVGRIGCFFAGLADDTYGKATNLPWGVDFGDGIRRHPTQLYEIVFLAALGLLLWRFNAHPHRQGQAFRIFLFAYLTWRLVIDFLKPQPLVAGMNLIQWTCVAGLLTLALSELRSEREAASD